jgi:hypothetical protein
VTFRLERDCFRASTGSYFGIFTAFFAHASSNSMFRCPRTFEVALRAILAPFNPGKAIRS